MSKTADKIKSRLKSIDPITAITAVGMAAIVTVTYKFTAANSAAYTDYLNKEMRILSTQADRLFDLAVDTVNTK